MVAAVKAAGLVDDRCHRRCPGDGPFTVFAPTDALDAVARLGEEARKRLLGEFNRVVDNPKPSIDALLAVLTRIHP